MPDSKPSRLPKLTADSLQPYVAAAIENAIALIQEATLLLKAGHKARTYFLAVAAIEEIGKAILAFDGQGRKLNDPAVVTTLLNAMNDHGAKIRAAFTGFIYSNPRRNLMPAVDLIIALKNGREPAMYTDLRADLTIQVPSTVVSLPNAESCVRLANDCLRSAEAHLAKTVPENRSAAENQIYALKEKQFRDILNTEDFWWFYIDQRESGTKDFAEAALAYRNEFILKSRKFQS